jgi:hypothetical protein
MAWLIPSLELLSAASVFFGGLFVACMFCHGELALMKPDPRWLTRFYLMLSFGGALGAVLIAIVAPLVLPGYFEVNIALILLALTLSLRLRGAWRLVGLVVFTATAFFSVRGAQEYSCESWSATFTGWFAPVTGRIRHRIARCSTAASFTAANCWAISSAISRATISDRPQATAVCSKR